jgi:intracellular multiplication protein IcmL
MPDAATETARFLNSFYRDGYRKLLTILLISIVLNVVLGAFIYLQRLYQPKATYFATNESGKLNELIPLDIPYVSQELLLSFADQAAVTAYSFDFLNYQQQLQQAKKYFTDVGFTNFMNALQASGNLKVIQDKHLVVKAVVTDVPVILKEGVLPGTNQYAWQVQIPMLVQYISASEKIQQPIVATILIVRVSTLETRQGIAIASFTIAQRPKAS